MGKVDSAGSSTSLLEFMETRLGSLKQHPDCAIFRVPQNLRQVDPSAYEPMFVSIGPYHYTPALDPHEHVSIDIDVKELRPKLQQGQALKWHFLQDFLGRNDKVSLTDYISLIKGLELEARKCYVEVVSLGSDEFNRVMLLDACFILEFLFQETEGEKGKQNYRQYGNNMGINCVYNDLLLLENQLPMFILEETYNRFRNKDLAIFPPLDDLVFRTFKLFLTNRFGKIKACLTRRAESEDDKISSKYYHLVHLVHAHLFDPPKPTRAGNRSSNYHAKIDRSASTLRAMGVKIKRPRERTSLFDIKFDNGVLQLPHHPIFDSTGKVLRNFIAFEQTSEYESVHHYFSPYAFFMDDLINTVRDVDTLEKYGVLTSHIGSNENVANLFNQIGIGCINYNHKNYLLEIQTRLEEYCKITRHRWRAKLLEDYFSNPWSVLSLLAAIVLLVLTALQTIFSILP